LKNYSGDLWRPVCTAADYQDPWLQKQLDDNGWILWAPIRFGATTIDFATQTPFLRPLDEKLAGYRCQRRRCAGRILYGTRISILFGLLLTFFSSVLGVLAGAIQGTTAVRLTCGASGLLRCGQACQPCS
jgi:microcin C transport system permease protein